MDSLWATRWPAMVCTNLSVYFFVPYVSTPLSVCDRVSQINIMCLVLCVEYNFFSVVGSHGFVVGYTCDDPCRSVRLFPHASYEDTSGGARSGELI